MPALTEISESANQNQSRAATPPSLKPTAPLPRKPQQRSRMNIREHAPTFLLGLGLFLAACVMFFANLGEYPLFNPDESLYAEPAREMLDTGEYITTLLNYVVRFTKPPLVIWAMALGYKVFGVNEFAARFVGAACGAILVAATFFFANKYASKRAATIAAFSLITAPLFVGTAREAITDMPLSLFIAGALMAFYHGFKQRIGAWRWVGYVLVGLAVMTKGPVGLILPVAVLGVFHLLRGELKDAWRYYKPFAGLAVVAAIALPWFVTEIYVTKGAYYQEFLVRENFQRFTSVVDHKGAWWYHLAAVAGGYFPWSLFAIPALASIVLTGRRMASTVRVNPGQTALVLYCVLTFAVIVGFFSVSVSKLLPYTLPAFPALAIITGVFIDKQMNKAGAKTLAWPFVVLAVAAAVALLVVPIALVRLREMPPQLPAIIQSGLLCLGVGAVAAAIGMFIKRPQVSLILFSSVLFACFLVTGKRALDVLSNEWEAQVPHFARFAALSGDQIVVWHMRKPSITFYAGRQVTIPLNEEQLTQAVTEKPSYIIGKAADMPTLGALPGVRLLLEEGRFVLLRSTAPSQAAGDASGAPTAQDDTNVVP